MAHLNPEIVRKPRPVEDLRQFGYDALAGTCLLAQTGRARHIVEEWTMQWTADGGREGDVVERRSRGIWKTDMTRPR